MLDRKTEKRRGKDRKIESVMRVIAGPDSLLRSSEWTDQRSDKPPPVPARMSRLYTCGRAVSLRCSNKETETREGAMVRIRNVVRLEEALSLVILVSSRYHHRFHVAHVR